MGRYDSVKKSMDTRQNIKKYSTTLYDEIPKLNSDIYVIAQEGDRLDSLAFEYYGDQHLWWFLARANHLKAMNVPAGTRLRVPISTTNITGR